VNKIRVVKVSRPISCDNRGFILSERECKKPKSSLFNEIDLMFTEDEVGEKICIELIEMDEEEFNKLPEFAGW